MTLFLDRTEKGKKSAFDTAVAEEVADDSKKKIELIIKEVGRLVWV